MGTRYSRFLKINENMLEFRKAVLDDVSRVYALKQKMLGYKYPGFSWSESYPTEEVFRNDILRGEMYVLESRTGDLLGAVSVNEIHDDHYNCVLWEGQTPVFYIHRLFVDPCRRGEHLGEEILRNVIERMRANGYRTARLDTFSENRSAQKLYHRMGFNLRGVIPLTGKIGLFYAYELCLQNYLGI